MGVTTSLAHDAGPPRVLIVQPQRAYLNLFGKRVAEAGFRVATAQSAQAAVAELYRAPVDLILAELRGPGYCGRELVTMVRGDSILRDIPILMLTGRGDAREAIEVIRDGADATVKKPFHFEILIARIERELERKRLVDDLRRDRETLDARIVERAIQLGELKERLAASEAELRRLQRLTAPTSLR